MAEHAPDLEATKLEPTEPESTGPRAEAPVALVTGAARGIGAATVRALAADGWNVVAVDRCADYAELDYPMGSRADLDAVAASTGADGAGVLCAVVDVRDQGSLDTAVSLALERFGRLDAAVAAAGVMVGAAHGWELPAELFDLCLDVNLSGVHRTAVAAVPAILRTASPGAGRFVAVASAAGLSGRPAIAAYTAAKHGVIGLVRSLAAELGPAGVTANCVAPGSTDTAILGASAALYGLADPAEFAVHHPIGRLIEPAEVAAAVAWLCAPGRSAITGIVLPVDGGMTL